MQAYETQAVIASEGTLTLNHLPFPVGERVFVTVKPQPGTDTSQKYPLRGMIIRDLDPNEPATAESDWEVYQ